MRFDQPYWLFLGLTAFLGLLGLFFYSTRKQQAALKLFASEHLLATLTANVSPGRRRVKRWFLILSITLCFVALARPQWGFQWEEVQRKGIDMVFAVDTSRSMLAEDVKPNRLIRAKLAVLDLVSKLEGDRVGLIAFAGTAFLQCPLTLDYDAFRQCLDALDTEVIPKGGTNVSSAIEEADQAFSLGGKSHKVLILITDGEDLEAQGIESARKAAEKEIKIFTVGVGTSEGELIPLRTETGGVEFLKDSRGQAVKSRLDESTLRQIAETTGAFYEPLGQQGQGLETIYQHGLSEIPKVELASRMNKKYYERFQWPLGIAILCLITEWMLNDRKQTARRSFFACPKWGRPTITASFLFGLFLLSSETIIASPQKAEKAYQNQNYDKAIALYLQSLEKRESPELRFNLGTAYYKKGKWKEAAEAFQKSLQSDKPEFQQQVFYNLGNAQYRIGQEMEKDHPDLAIAEWQKALQNYESALKLKSDDADARFNRDVVQKKLAQLQQSQQKKDSSNPKNSQNSEQTQKQASSSDTKKDEKNEASQSQQKDHQREEAKSNASQDIASSSPSEKVESKPEPAATHHQEKKSQNQMDNEKNLAQASSDSRKANPEKKDPESPTPLVPGQMTRDEAQRLLDGLKSDERKILIAPTPQRPEDGEAVVTKDW